MKRGQALFRFAEDGGHLVHGNQSLSIEVARRLGAAVRLESPVAGVELVGVSAAPLPGGGAAGSFALRF